ncbi:MAG: glycosyltransferase [Bdellovibrionales bacterium]|nr:glycosyltransferase [Bdellovibrionales bacterium]
MFVPLVMVRLLTPDDVGHFKIFFLYLTIVPAFSLTTGLISGLGYWAGQGERGRQAIRFSNGMIFISALIMTALALLASPLVSAKFSWPLEYAFYFAFSVLGSVSAAFYEESLIVTGRIWSGAAYVSGSEVIRSSVILISAWWSRSLAVVLLVSTVVALLKTTANMAFGFNSKLVSFKFDKKILAEIWKYSFPVSIAWVFGVVALSADQFILSNVLSPGDFAIYAIGCLSIPPLMILEQSVTRVMIPRMSEAFAQNQSKQAALHYRSAVEQLAWILIPAVTGLIVFAKPIIELLFTDQYSSAAQYLRYFALSYLLLIFPQDAVPRARGEGKWILKSFTAFAPLAPILCFVLGYKFAAFGALGGMILSRLAFKVYAIRYISKSTGWKLREFIPSLEIVIFALTSAALGFLSRWFKPESFSELAWLLTYGPALVILYFPITLLFLNRIRKHAAGHLGLGGNVLLFTQHLGIGGLERVVLTLGQTLKKTSNWNVSVFSHDSDEDAKNYTRKTLIQEFLESGIPVDALNKGPGFSFKTVARLIKNIFNNQIDVIHSHDMGTLIYAVIVKVLTLGRVRVVHTQHSFVHLGRHKRYQLYEKIFTSFVDQLTVVNESLVQPYLNLGISKNRIHVIHNGVSFPDHPVASRVEKIGLRESLMPSHSTDLWLLYLARLHSVKGQRDMARVWESLDPKVRSKSVLLVVGPEAEAGERNQVLESFSKVPDRDRVIFIDGTKVPQQWLAASDLFISCSKFEGMPLGPLEALGAGLPAVLSEIDGHGFLKSISKQFSLGDFSSGARQIEAVLSESDFGSQQYYARHWSSAAWIRERFSLKAMAGQYAKLYPAQSAKDIP